MENLEAIVGAKGGTVHTTVPEATVLEAVDQMCRLHVGALVVVRRDEIVGVFSERDLMTRVVLQQRDPATTHVGEVMTTEVVSVSVQTSSHEAMALMTSQRVRHLPVTNGTRMLGLVSIGDMVRAVIADRERLVDELQGYVTGRYPA
jgi:signal-transduction protein with cAMP-binding, CBS, and nucleotidyltransferase domain